MRTYQNRCRRYPHQQQQHPRYPPPKVIAIDVDKTLMNPQGEINNDLVNWANEKYQDGYQLIIWSSRGTEHAQKAAEKAGLANIMLAAISKPGLVVDDQGWGWIKYTKVVSPNSLE